MALPMPGKPKNNSPVHSKRSTEGERMTMAEVKAFMKSHGIGEKEFAELLGVTIQAVTLWMNGKREFSVTNSRLLRMFEKYPKLIREF